LDSLPYRYEEVKKKSRHSTLKAILRRYLLTKFEASQLLRVSPNTLSNWRQKSRRQILPYCKIGRSVRYRLAALQTYVKRRTVGESALK